MTDKVSMELKPKKTVTDCYPQRRRRDCPCNGSYRLPWRRRENIPTAGAASPEASPATPASTTSNDDGKSDDAYDIVGCGGGPAGYVAAIKAAQLGGKVALVEKSELGGTCLNRGCIPTKTYLHNAGNYWKSSACCKSWYCHLKILTFTVDMDKVLEPKLKLSIHLSGGVAGLLRSYGVDVYKGGTITKDKNVLVNGSELLKPRRSSLAGGSKVSKINVHGMESSLVMTSDDILDMKEVPESLVIIGGGVVVVLSSDRLSWHLVQKVTVIGNDGSYCSSYGCRSL